MTTSHTAQGLASLGRNGDSMLVHMSPNEVSGLQSLAMANGGSLSINPETGLPEAFSLGGAFSSLLPMAAGMFMGPAAGAMFGPGAFSTFLSSPLGAGLTTGALTAAMTGDIGKGAMAGLGAAGGAGLGQGISNFGATGSAAAPAAATTAGLNEGITKTALQQAMTGGVPGVGIKAGAGAIPGAAGVQLPQYAGAQGFAPSAIGNSSFAKGLGSVADVSPSNLLGAGVDTSAKNLLGTTVEATKPLTAFESLGKGASAIMESPGKFIESYGPGKLAMPIGGAVLAGLEPSDLGYGTDNLYEDPDKDKYRGPQGQLNLSDKFDTGLRLVAQGGAIKSYAIGGSVGNPSVGGGLADLYNRPEGQALENISQDGYGIGRLNSLANKQAMTTAQTLGYAEGGETSLDLDALPSLNLNFVTKPSENGSGMRGQPDRGSDPLGFLGGLRGQPYTGSDPLGFRGGLGGQPYTGSDPLGFRGGMGSGIGSAGSTPPAPTSYALNLNSGKQEAQYAQGGYLNGQGDGMSDSIPATIEGKQPARLADGEFVVPADVVSHLGNGSSKAGSKRLYAMLDKVRHARTGNKKQGKEIKAEKYLPA